MADRRAVAMTAFPDIVSVAVLAVAPWPVLRFVSIPSIRREYSRVALAAVAALGAYFACVIAIAFVAPSLLAPLAAVAACALAIERWRARPSFGTRRGLPPGSLTLVPRGPWVDEKFYASQMERHGPVFKMSQFFRPMVCVMGPGEGIELLERHAGDLFSPPVRFSRFIPKGYIRYMAPQDHSLYKAQFRAAFSSKVLQACSADLRALISEDLERLSTVSQATKGGVHPAPFIADMTFRCMLRLFIGLAADSPDIERLSRLYRKVEIGKAASRWRSEDRAAANEIAAYIGDRLQQGGRLPPCFLRELGNGGGQAADETVLLNLVYMIRISGSDLAGFLTWACKLLVDNPEWFEGLRAAGSTETAAGVSALSSLVVKEVLRMERSEYIFRKARADIRFKAFEIPRNWIVRICIRDGHRDELVFEHADTFDPMRFKNRSYSKKEFSPLGIGAHACLGGQIVNLLGSIFVTELARTYRVSVVADGNREYGRSHWEPSRALRVVLGPIQPASVP